MPTLTFRPKGAYVRAARTAASRTANVERMGPIARIKIFGCSHHETHLLASVIFTPKGTRQTAIYELPWTALAQMGEIKSRLPPEQRYAAVMKLDTDKLYSVMQPR